MSTAEPVGGSTRLRRYYEELGFERRGDRVVRGAPGQRLEGGSETLVSLYELAVRVSVSDQGQHRERFTVGMKSRTELLGSNRVAGRGLLHPT